MKRHHYRKLLNREVDGLTTPEEEATLMDHVSRSAEAAEEQAWFHRIHQTLRGMKRPVAPEGLSQRVADRVLAEPGATLSLARASRGFARMAASFVLVLCIGGVAGYLAHGDVRGGASAGQVAIGRQGEVLREKLQLGPEAMERIREINARYDRLIERKEQELGVVLQELADRELAEILDGLEPEQREAYRKIDGMTPEEMDRLLELVR
jgi:hypothetical protein